MSWMEFAREIERANRRMVELRRSASDEVSASWVEAALGELSSALEELKVAEEEISSQNRDLAEAQAVADFERLRYRDLFMTSPFGQLVTDLRGTILEANRAAGELLGTPSANLVGKPLALLVALGDRERFVGWIARLGGACHEAPVCAESGGSGDYAIQTLDRGRLFPCEIFAAPLADRLERITSIRWSLLDSTDRERALTAETLRADARHRDGSLAILGHELRNPLSVIQLAVHVLRGEDGDAMRKDRAAETIQQGVEQISRLVDDLFDTSRVPHGRQRPLESVSGDAEGSPQSDRGHRILIVEDDADTADLLADILCRLGYQVDVAYTGQGGLDAARQAPSRVALVDLGLPDLDGFEVCRVLKQQHPELAVVALTGYSDSGWRDQASRAGFDRFLVKPLDAREVAAVLAELLGPPP